MRRHSVVVVALCACGKGSGSGSGSASAPAAADESPITAPLASPEQAAAVATKLAAALNACDTPAIAALYDPRAIARDAIGKDDARFLDLAAKATVSCGADRMLVVDVIDGKRPKPLLRWRRGTIDTRERGYLELYVAGTPPRVMDIASPLHRMSVATGLHNIYTNGLSEGDQVGMVSDIFSEPFMGLQTGAGFASRFDREAFTSTTEGNPDNLGLVIERAFMAHDWLAAALAADKLGKLVGPDVEVAGLQIAAALGAGHIDAALQQARDTTTKWPADEDAWQLRLAAEMAGGTKAGIDECKAALAKLAAH